MPSPHFLLIDSGNTRTKAAIYQDDKQLQFWTFENTALQSARIVLSSLEVKGVLLADSGGFGTEILSWFPHVSARVLMPDLNLGIHWAYENPALLGQDRRAGMMGALARFPDVNLCVVSAGTCLTVDFLRHDRIHLGGVISPGLEMRLKAMNEFTSRLPYVPKNKALIYPGISTETCIAGGAVWGGVMEVEAHFSMAATFGVGTWKLVLTGGDADFLARRIKADNFVAPNLVLEGLNAVVFNP